MRLTHLKIAGFKSFVDPTTLHLHGQRIGVVGPNGCGKSNVMESVRWVLGESSARELRGDSMEDVIFNGSANRVPIARASVELVFDNSLGGSQSSAWSQYAEISVKRVIERSRGSTYYINNTAVRRRDVADLFLGTGLGGRAYAMIGQNTISRLIEARPEEMRVVLEEAAGISKYKERRRETELRLRDTRENLLRIEDIRQEIDKQIQRLQAQAEVAQSYHDLHAALQRVQAQLWLLKRRDAGLEWQRCKTQTNQISLALESQMRNLRQAELQVETLRQQHQAHADHLQLCQREFYEVNAEVSNLETQLHHHQQAIAQLQQQIAQWQSQSEKITSQLAQGQQQLAQISSEQQQAILTCAQADMAVRDAASMIPALEREAGATGERHSKSRQQLEQAQRQQALETQALAHVQRELQENVQRKQQLESQQASVQMPSAEKLERQRTLVQHTLTAISEMETQLAGLVSQEQALLAGQSDARNQLTHDERTLAGLRAQIASLEKIQSRIAAPEQLDVWLKRQQIEWQGRLWQLLEIRPGWEQAIEVVLGEQLHALLLSDSALLNDIHERPPATVMLCHSQVRHEASQPALAPDALRHCVQGKAAWVNALLDIWLAGFRAVDRDNLLVSSPDQPGETWVNRAGDRRTAYGILFFAAGNPHHGVLERQRELEQQRSLYPEAEDRRGLSQARLESLQAEAQAITLQMQSLRLQIKTQTQLLHQLNLEQQKEEQAAQHAKERQQQISKELAELTRKISHQQEDVEAKRGGLSQRQEMLQQNEVALGLTLAASQQASLQLQQARQALNMAEKQAQEKSYQRKILDNRLNDLTHKLDYLAEELKSVEMRRKETELILNASSMHTLKANLEAAIHKKGLQEKRLAQARNQMATLDQEMQQMERQRLQIEQQLHPLRDQLEQARLDEQACRIQFEQCAQGFQDTGLEESILQADLQETAPGKLTVAGWTDKAQRLQNRIQALGSVNLAAIHELAQERERQQYLQQQSSDLTQSVQTLEEAIIRIDKETRGRMMQTYQEANRHFAELFQTLFGGGNARLELQGDEILDSGLLVFAQPPGKKNATIHMLSGGEKALTALALVFALFRLNPAPFCLMDEVDAPLDDSNTERFCNLVKKMSERTQFLFISHNRITMEMAQQLIGVTMQESGVSRVVEVDIEAANRLQETLQV